MPEDAHPPRIMEADVQRNFTFNFKLQPKSRKCRTTEILTGLFDSSIPIHQVMVIKKHAHWLAKNTENKPEYDVPHH